MKITLYLPDKILKFKLPYIVSGQFSFDANEEEESKLIHIEARNGKWVLLSTSEVSLADKNSYVKEIILTPNQFYTLEKNKVKYTIYVSPLSFTGMCAYTYGEQASFTLGNTSSSTICYSTNYLNGLTLTFTHSNNQLTFTKTGLPTVYVNRKFLDKNFCQLFFGDELEVYGLTILFLKNVLLFTIMPNVTISARGGGILKPFVFPDAEVPENREVKDVDLYQKEDYYSKSPRLRRVITTKEISFSTPPRNNSQGEMPLFLVIGPMLTMGITSLTMFANTFIRLQNGETTFKNSWAQLVTSSVMFVSMLLWPLLTQWYNRRQKKRLALEIKEKYTKYLNEKRLELEKEREQQKIILYENLIPLEDCLQIIQNKNIHFWDKRLDQSDFLVVRLGIGREFLDVKISYPEEGFTIEENELKDRADDLVREFEYIENVPLGYSLYENKITAIMGTHEKSIYFAQNLLLQIMTFYSYEDVKIVLFTNEARKEEWKFLKYLPHSFSNERDFRFVSTCKEDAKKLAVYISTMLQMRKSKEATPPHKPHYILVIDEWDSIYQNDSIKELTEIDDDLGFSLLILENRMGKLPSKCNNFISLDGASSKVLKNSYDEQVQMFFKEEIHYNLPMFPIAKNMANVPIEFEEGFNELPNAISFLEMERVGKVDGLNILNRWNSNDATSSLRAEIGVDAHGDLMYLDLHEKAHGPHGLIAGMTGSGKSEFIITYILSMAMNYSPDDVSFILIDYKGGGLAFAFENQATGKSLPHLSGTITNLDKAEMDRTLVSIDSEVKRRQQVFNEARDYLGESTIDIYKYQTYFKEGKLQEAVPHLFIICDEFAELKAQQPDFMDNLISVARIGRSLGVHLILATQKPSGVVNDQIWSNTKFRVCLKVQDESDSKEMLKRPEAAAIKQTGRFYLQVGYDEYFALGQSAWCGAKYYPSDKVIKQVDKSLNFITNCGEVYKSIQASNNIKVEAQGEQLAAILDQIISIARATGKQANRLWLPNIPEVLVESDLESKYGIVPIPYHVTAILGEFDAPERQEQGIVTYPMLESGNTIVYGNDGKEREMFLDTLIYSCCKNHSTDEVNFYIIDYGSEALRKYQNLLHVGGIVFAGEDEKFYNLLKLIREDLQKRKKAFADYGGSYQNYLKVSQEKKPLKVVIINNYDSLYENYPEIYEEMPELVRDSERLGIVFVFTAAAINSVPSKITQSCKNMYAFKLKDTSDYISVFGVRTKIMPRDILGRGVINNDGLHEFQVCAIKKTEEEASEYLPVFIEEQNKKNERIAKKIPTLPEIVRLGDIKEELKSLSHFPVGISKKELEIVTMDFSMNTGNLIASNKLSNTEKFVKSILYLFRLLSNTNVLVVDPLKSLSLDKMQYPNYYTENFSEVISQIILYIKNLIEVKSEGRGVLLIYGFSKFVDKLEDKSVLTNLFQVMKEYEYFSCIAVDDAPKLKTYAFEAWFTSSFSTNDGIWIGRGLAEQNLFRLSNITKEMMADYKTDMGYIVSENMGTLVKFVDLFTKEEENEE